MRWFGAGRQVNQQSWPDYTAYRAEATASPLLASFHGAGVPEPGMPIADVPLLTMDIETTGLDPSHDGILSIALVPFSIRRIPLGERRYWIVRPQEEVLSSHSVVLHHITHSDIAAAPDLSVILEGLLETMAGRIPVVHYRSIERRFLDAAVRARLGEGLLFPVIDTMGLEAERHRLSLRSRLLAWMGREPTSIRLGESRRRYGLPVYQGHHALRDAIATAELLQAQIAWRFRPDTPLARLWS